MKNRFLWVSLLLCLIIAGTANAQTQGSLTEKQVSDLIVSVDRAARQKNLVGLTGPLARDVKIKLTLSTPANPEGKVLSLTKDQYTLYTRRIFRERYKYTLERKNTRIKLYDDGRTAMVTSDLYETLTVPQGSLRTVTSEVALLSLRDGKLLFTSIDDRARIY